MSPSSNDTGRADPPDSGSEQRLLNRVRRGSSSVVNALFERYAPWLRRRASGRLPQWARSGVATSDLVQDVLHHTFARLNWFESKHVSALRAYLRRYQGCFCHLANLARSLTTPVAAGLLLTLAAMLAIMPAQAQGEPQLETCPGGGYDPTPTAVAVGTVPIVVSSTAAEYFVLYVTHDVGGTEVEVPVLVKKGDAGTTTLAQNVEALPKERYRLEKYLVADPADIDGDCIDDITELDDMGRQNPVNPAVAIELRDGTVAVPDKDTYDTLAVTTSFKFVLFGMDTDRPGVYFMNTNTHPLHESFLEVAGLDAGDVEYEVVNGKLTYSEELVASDGSPGVYYFELKSVHPPLSIVNLSYTLLAASMPLLDDNLAFYIRNFDLPLFQSDLPLYRESRIDLVFDADIFADTSFLPLNPGEGYGRLQVLDPDERPHPRDVVIYEALPNELPRVAGIITTVPQTPLSHVNLRAVQDGIPNAFIRDALDKPSIAARIGNYIHYTVTEKGWDLRAANPEEVDAHYESSRPSRAQTPEFNLSVTGITPLSQIGFEDWTAFGVKAANVAVLGRLGFPAGTVPNGFAIPFYFYDEFMKAHDFYTRIETMLTNEDFQTDFEVQDDRLDDLRDDIKDAETPQWIKDALTAMHAHLSRGAPPCATGRAPTTKTCRGSTARGCTTPRPSIPRRPRRMASTSRSSRCSPACGPFAPSPSGSSTASITWRRRWGCWCIPTTPTSWPTALRSALTPFTTETETKGTTSTRSSARIWSPIPTRSRCQRKSCYSGMEDTMYLPPRTRCRRGNS